jgi:hypothetical protein
MLADSSGTPQQAALETETRQEVFVNAVDVSFENELNSFGGNFGLEFPMDGDHGLQAAPPWVLRGWPANSHSFLFQ